MSSMAGHLMNRKIEPRVGQIDASILDSELLNMLKEQLWKGFKYFRPDIKDKYESELVLILKLALFKLTVWDHSTTYGAKLQSLKFMDARSAVSNQPITKSQKLGYGLLVVGGSYLWQKLDDHITNATYAAEDPRGYERLRQFTDSLSTLWSVSTLANFVLFLYSGKYSTLILRILRIRLGATTRKVSRSVNFEFQNRQLVWNAFTEFLLFILPLLNLAKIKRTVLKYIFRADASKPQTGELSFLPEKTCAICYKEDEGNAVNKEVTSPYKADCGHVYCYVCIKSKLLENEGEGWTCLRCGQLIRSIEPYIDIDPKAVVVKDLQPDEDGNITDEKKANSDVKDAQKQNNPDKEPSHEPSESEDEGEGDDEDEDDDDDDDDNQQSGFVVEDF
ncbi:hypothetical protein TRICI_003893 [Trichomonascus ciferrii]|uniref:RING-type E3 ubiquitin transferase (cysteine targeting) n=1 Tax=Trichomonascus ciferrii TaxID=44093 RepID=A0A642V2E3_9ASCO|nr:hypothetical protein TRICI_003893 [Trichomonascus ciferrii]